MIIIIIIIVITCTQNDVIFFWLNFENLLFPFDNSFLVKFKWKTRPKTDPDSSEGNRHVSRACISILS